MFSKREKIKNYVGGTLGGGVRWWGGLLGVGYVEGVRWGEGVRWRGGGGGGGGGCKLGRGGGVAQKPLKNSSNLA